MAPSPVPRFDALRGILLALPALALSWPLPGLLSEVPSTASCAAGWLLTLVLPALLLTVVSQRRPWTGLGPVPAGFALLALLTFGRSLFGTGDPFEADRASASALAAAAFVLCAGRLAAGGRRTLVLSLSVTPVLQVLGSLIEGRREGILGNAGDTAEALAPALGLCLWLFASQKKGLRMLALSSLLMGLTWSLLAEARSLWLALLCCALAACLARFFERRRARSARIALVLALLATLGFSLSHLGDSLEGGIAFRRAVWATAPALLRAHPFGVGPGQLQREYPPFRDPAEIEISEHGRLEPTPVDVEHLHNDGLNFLVEGGLVQGGLTLLLLVMVFAGSLRALLKDDGLLVAAGLGVLAAMATGLVNAPWSFGVVSPAIGLPLVGLLFPSKEVTGRSRSLGPDGLLLVLVVAALPSARQLVLHGHTLAELRGAVVRTQQEDGAREDRLLENEAREIVERALAAQPFSTLALSRLEGLLAPDSEQRRQVLLRLLELRPHQRQALINLANLYARRGEFAAASDLVDRALVLDPHSPLLAGNSLLLALDSGDRAGIARAAERVRASQAWQPGRWREELERRLLLGERMLAGELAAVVSPGLDLSSGEALLAASGLAASRGQETLEAAYATAAHQTFAMEALASDDLEGTVRSLRQALRSSAGGLQLHGIEAPRGARALRLALAGALFRQGDEERARAELLGLEPTARDLLRLPAELGDALLALGALQAGD